MARRNVFLYVPNLVGYLRIILLIVSSFYVMNSHRFALGLYLTSCLLDAVDGFLARLLNQSSLLGAMLDMLTDRVSTMCLVMNLGILYSNSFQIFQLLLIIDIVSHWLHFFTAKLDNQSGSHKNFGSNIPLIHLYYQNKLVLTTICALEQIFYASLLIYHFENDYYSYYLALMSFPGLLFKNWVNILQIYNSCIVIASIKQA